MFLHSDSSLNPDLADFIQHSSHFSLQSLNQIGLMVELHSSVCNKVEKNMIVQCGWVRHEQEKVYWSGHKSMLARKCCWPLTDYLLASKCG